MTKHEFYILNDLYNGRQGRGGCTSDIDRTRALDDQAAINALTGAGLIDRDTGALTGAGLAALEPYRVVYCHAVLDLYRFSLSGMQ